MKQTGLIRNLSLIVLSGAILFCLSCRSENKSEFFPYLLWFLYKSNEPAVTTVPSLLFGANYDWNYRAYYSIENGDYLRDRSFRSRADLLNKIQVWNAFSNSGGTITFNTTVPGDTNPAGGKSYPGYAELSQGAGPGGLTGIYQYSMVGIKAGKNYDVYFSSYGDTSAANVDVYIFNSAMDAVLASSTSITVENGIWKQHKITFTPSVDENIPAIAIFLATENTAIRIDEVRMLPTGLEPKVKASLKAAIQNLRVTTLRWLRTPLKSATETNGMLPPNPVQSCRSAIQSERSDAIDTNLKNGRIGCQFSFFFSAMARIESTAVSSILLLL